MIDQKIHNRVLVLYPMLQGLGEEELATVLSTAAYMKVPAGAMMFDEKQPCMGFPLLLTGKARVVKASPNGRELHLYHVEPGETCILTSSCLLGKVDYQARGVVDADMEIVVLPPATFKLLLAKVDSFRDHIFSRFSERLTELLAVVSAVTFQKLDQRLAAALLAKTSPIHSTHQALADELGSLRELISRLLKNFADKGWLRLGREYIEVLDAAALRQFASL